MNKTKVLLVASECRGFVKIGGLADVVRDLAIGLTAKDIDISVMMPYYESMEIATTQCNSFPVTFAGKTHRADIYFRYEDDIRFYFVRNKIFFGEKYKLPYTIDSQDKGPFEDDAMRFAFFSAAAIQSLLELPDLEDVTTLHCNDWHTGVIFPLLKYDNQYSGLNKQLTTIFTIHNLKYQGTRPFYLPGEDDTLSFLGWFPWIYKTIRDNDLLDPLTDKYADIPCFNPMQAGINLADKVTTVSPQYAKEILQADNPSIDFIGGGGLEDELLAKSRNGDLVGILNAINYKEHSPLKALFPFSGKDTNFLKNRKLNKKHLLQELEAIIGDVKDFAGKDELGLKAKNLDTNNWEEIPIVTIISRTVSQKIGLLLTDAEDNFTTLQNILRRDIILIILGVGNLDETLAYQMKPENSFFINSFDPNLANKLYAGSDIFLMPSSFEPCGLGQMIAMHYGVIPIVHDIGGLHDTVNKDCGFLFDGNTKEEKVKSLLITFDQALDIFNNDKERWQKMQKNGMMKQFNLKKQTESYLKLYKND